MSSTPTYIFENGLRKVLPYYQLYQTHIKTRWEGLTILDVYTKELGQQAPVIINEIKNHQIYILENFGKQQQSQYIKGWDILQHRKICKHDVIYNLRHMHEPSVIEDQSLNPDHLGTVSASRIGIIHKCNDFLVINKPSGIPTHPTSNYRYNSITEILKYDLNLSNIWPSHRLDKLTSGVLMFGLNKKSGQMLLKIIEHKGLLTKKIYYARVKGSFPVDPISYTCPVFLINVNGGYIMPTNTGALPINCTTKFRRLQYNEALDESIVECMPITGKMHQIRIHLRNLGFPITNDFVYNHTHTNWLSELNQLKNQIELKIYGKLFHKYPDLRTFTVIDQDGERMLGSDKYVNIDQFINDDDEIIHGLSQIRQLALQRLDQYKNQHTCSECGRSLFELERLKDKSFIYLHAHQYIFSGDEEFDLFNYQSQLPQWCVI